MNISELGEFNLIARITKKPKDKHVLVGIGDDTAVIEVGKRLLLFTTDTLVEGDHYSLDYFTPEQVGMKAMEINISDIVAMGGKPKYVLVSLVLNRDTKLRFVDGLYRGLWKVCKKYKIDIVGGNMTHGEQNSITISMLGYVNKKELCLRSNAKVGDFILVTGDLGKSTAGLKVLINKIQGYEKVKKAHLEPKAKPHKVKRFLRYINAMEDISDGLAAEVKHICEQSKVGAIIYTDKIPIDNEVKEVAKIFDDNALDYALYGGEDFELVFTVSEKDIGKVRGYLVGEIVEGKDVWLYSKGKKSRLIKHGYDHFIQ